MYIRIGSLCSILCWSIFGSNHSSLRLERCTAVLITLQRWEFGLCPEATPVLSWLCACSCCPVWRLTFAPVWGPERSGAGYRQGSIHLYLISLPVPAVKKHPHSMKLPPPCFTVGWHWSTDVQLLVQSLFHRTILQVPFGKLQAGCHVPHKPDWWSAAEMLVQSNARVTIWFLDTSLTKALLSQSLRCWNKYGKSEALWILSRHTM